MDANREIGNLVARDRQINKIGNLVAVHRQKDINHLERRQQQRAISTAMIKVAVMYGKKGFSRGAIVFTLNDRILKWTPYYKFIDVLRGLRVVCLSAPPNPEVLTAYWHEETRRRARR